MKGPDGFLQWYNVQVAVECNFLARYLARAGERERPPRSLAPVDHEEAASTFTKFGGVELLGPGGS
jgi:hypothetical protein